MRRLSTVWPFRHAGLKLLSIGLAVLLWLTVAGQEQVERGLRVPLELQQFPAGLELQGEAPATVDVRVRGASATLGRVSPGDIVAVLDLHAARPGHRLFHLTTEQVHAPFGVEVVQVSPATVAMSFEESATRQVPVVPSVEGRPAPGFVVGTTSVTPDVVEVVGPASAVRRVTEAVTEPVSVTGARDRVTETVNVGLMDPSLRLKTPRAAAVTVHIQPAPVERTLHGVPVHLRALGARLSAQAVPAIVTLTVRGSREALARIDADAVSAYVDLAGLGSGQYTLTVRGEASADAGVTHIDPASVQVRISSGRN